MLLKTKALNAESKMGRQELKWQRLVAIVTAWRVPNRDHNWAQLQTHHWLFQGWPKVSSILMLNVATPYLMMCKLLQCSNLAFYDISFFSRFSSFFQSMKEKEQQRSGQESIKEDRDRHHPSIGRQRWAPPICNWDTASVGIGLWTALGYSILRDPNACWGY